MSALKNRRHEEFCRRVVAGEPAAQAYIAAGFSRAGARQGASRLLTTVNIATRIAELKPAADKQRQEVLEQHIVGTIKERAARIQGYNDRRQALYDVIAARARDLEHQDVPGAKTGLVAITFKMAGKEKFKEAAIDVALLRELRELEKQAAIELGQWVEKSDGTLNVQDLRDMPEELVDRIIAQGEALRLEREAKVMLFGEAVKKPN
jgi:phage terminase small subunit